MKTEVGQARFFRALGHPTRVRIVQLLAEGEKSVGELVEHIGIQQAQLSSHLSRLRISGLVRTRRSGRQELYRVADTRVLEMLEIAQDLLRTRAAHIPMCEPWHTN